MKNRCSCVRCVFRTSRITAEEPFLTLPGWSLQCKLLPVVIKGIICANNWGALMRESPDFSVRLFGGFLHSKGLWKQNCPIISSQDAVQEACFKSWQSFYSCSVCQHVYILLTPPCFTFISSSAWPGWTTCFSCLKCQSFQYHSIYFQQVPQSCLYSAPYCQF